MEDTLLSVINIAVVINSRKHSIFHVFKKLSTKIHGVEFIYTMYIGACINIQYLGVNSFLNSGGL